jgi:hypothetical protein
MDRARTWLLAAALVALAAGCRTTGLNPDIPLEPPGKEVKDAKGTVQGRVIGPDRTGIPGRQVTVVGVGTSIHEQTTTVENGGYSFVLPPGTYRLQVTLASGEAMIESPGEIHLTNGDIDSHRDIMVGATP